MIVELAHLHEALDDLCAAAAAAPTTTVAATFAATVAPARERATVAVMTAAAAAVAAGLGAALAAAWVSFTIGINPEAPKANPEALRPNRALHCKGPDATSDYYRATRA